MSELRVIRLLLPLLRTRPWAIPTIVTLGILASLAEGVGLSLFIPLLETVTTGAGSTDGASGGGWLAERLDAALGWVDPDDRLVWISAAIVASVLVRSTLVYANDALFAWLEARIGHGLRSRFFDHLMRVDYGYIKRTDAGRLLNALSNETWNTTEALSVVVRMLITVCTVVVYTGLLLLISWQLTAVVVVTMVAISLVVRWVTRRVDALSSDITGENAELATRMLEGCSGAKVIRSFAREADERARFDHSSSTVSRLVQRMALRRAAVGPVYEVLAAALLVGVLFIALRDDPSSLPSLLVFMAVLYRLQPRVRALDDQRVALLAVGGGVREVVEMMDPATKPFTPDGTVDAEGLEASFRFDGVGFRYEDGDEVALEGVTLDVPAGRTTALVGPSGAGKSTIVNLLIRLYEPTSGSISFGGTPLAAVRIATLRRRVALVSQDVHLFNASVRDNIAYGRPDADAAAVERAARLAHAHEFVVRLPDGYDTRLGDDGTRLSGGQRQRISLARAILCDPDVLVLDEATNALDSIAEHLIQEALELMRHGRTVVVVAHRLATIRTADQVVVLDRGRVRELGPPSDLLELDGMFAELNRLQRTMGDPR